MNDWKLIESAPRTGESIDLWTYNGYRYTDCFYDLGSKCWVQRVRYLQKNMKRVTKFMHVINPTHWMAIPEGPPTN
jgi:coenzyme F420-reducing hydrogenase delta subunit